MMRNLILAVAIMIGSGVVKAQNSNQWTPVLVNVDGTNTFKNVEVYYSLSSCGSDDVVILKMINANTTDVKAQWVTDIVTKDDKEHYGNTKLVSVKLKASSEVVGACNSNIKELVIKLSDFGVSKNDFSTIIGSSFYVE